MVLECFYMRKIAKKEKNEKKEELTFIHVYLYTIITVK